MEALMSYVTTSLKLPQEVMKDLKHKAVQEKKSVSQLVKEVVQQFLTAQKESVDYREDTFNRIIGMAKSGVHDGSVKHDQYLYGKKK